MDERFLSLFGLVEAPTALVADGAVTLSASLAKQLKLPCVPLPILPIAVCNQHFREALSSPIQRQNFSIETCQEGSLWFFDSQFRELRCVRNACDPNFSSVGQWVVFKAERQVSELDKSKNHTLSHIVHEIKAPLSVLSGYVNLFIKSKPDPQDLDAIWHTFQQNINKSVDGLNQIIEVALLGLRRAEVREFCVFDPLPTIQRLIEEREPIYPLRQFHTDFAQAPFSGVHGDSYLFEIALRNVLDNAIKYSPEQGVISVGMTLRKPFVGIAVTDQGIGIEPDAIEKLTQPYYRGTNSHNRDGHGLGLAIVKESLDLMCGHLEIQSRLGEWTTVTLWLPLAEPSVVQKQS